GIGRIACEGCDGLSASRHERSRVQGRHYGCETATTAFIREFLLGQKAHDVLRVVGNLIAPRPNVAATLANVRRWPPALGLTDRVHRSPSVPRCSHRRRRAGSYCAGIFTHAATSGLLAGTGLRQVADRSVGMTAALRRAPQ